MSEDVTSLNEIVVLGYSTTSKARLVNSAVQLDSKSLSQTPYVSAEQALQGKVAGLVITTPSGTPGSGMQIRIRGISSITAGNEPLFVIDGVPVNSGNVQYSTTSSTLNPLASIDTENIESITVLKDASSTALYGARGANGVIVVKTKRGKQGKTQFNATITHGYNNNATPGPTMLTPAQREELYYEAMYNTHGKRFNFTKDQAKKFYEDNVDSFGDQWVEWNKAGRPNHNWEDIITNKNAKFQQFDLSASGGGEGLNFFASLGYTKQDATVIASSFDRITGQVNLDKNLTKKLHFSTQNTGSFSKQNGVLEQSAYFSSPRTVKFFMSPTTSPYNADGTLNLNTGSMPNPLFIAANNINQSKLARVLTNNSLSCDLPIKDLKFTSRVALDWMIFNYKNFENRTYGDAASTNGSNTSTYHNNLNLVIQNYFDYEITAAENHRFSLKALQEYQRNTYSDLAASGNSFATEGLTNLANAGTPVSAYSSNSNWLLASYVGIMEYSAYKDKYILNASVRKEGNSRFSPENRWGNFWSVGAAWNVHKENFLKDIKTVSNLKLRASYGKTGNANINLNQYYPLLDFNTSYGGDGASVLSNYGNDKLTWETSFPFEAGVDAGLFDERITARFTYFYRETRDLLQNVPLTRTSGYASQLQNTGSLSNQGIEAEVNFAVVRKKDFNISFGGNAATTKNKILTLGKTPTGQNLVITGDGGITKTDIGHPVEAWFMRSWAGVDPQTGVDTWYADESRTATVTQYNSAALAWQGGGPIPIITAGMNIHADYKGIFLDANGYYAGGNKVFDDWNRYYAGGDGYALDAFNGLSALADRWQKPGDAARFPKLTLSYRPWQNSSKSLYDGDFFRLKSLTLGYNFKTDVLKKLKIEGIQLFVRATNYFTWVKDRNLEYDPEIAANGYTSLTTPPVKSIITGLNVKF